MNYCLRLFDKTFGPVQTDRRQTESDVYEPTVQLAQMGSKTTSHYRLGGHMPPLL